MLSAAGAVKGQRTEVSAQGGPSEGGAGARMMSSGLLLLLLLLLLQMTSGAVGLTVTRQTVRSDLWPESECRCEATWAERHVDHADPVKVLPDGLQHIDLDLFAQLRQQFLERLYGYSFSQLPGRVELELDLASNDPGHPLRVLEDLGSAEYDQFVQAAQVMAQVWGLRQSMLSQRSTFLSWMRVPGDVLMPCICPTGAVVAISIRFPGEEFLDEMKDPDSEETVAFTNNFHDQVTAALAIAEPAIVDVHVISLEAGSIIVNADVLLSTSMDKSLAISKVETALKTNSEQSNPPAIAGMTIDPSAFVYEVMECDEDAPPAPVNGLVSVPSHRTTGTRAVYTCSPGYVFSDGVTSQVELVCGHATRTWGSVPLLCERPRTTTVAGDVTTSVTTTEPPTTTTEEPEMDYVTVVTLPSAAGMLIFFFLLIWCVSTKGPICSLITDKKKKNISENP